METVDFPATLLPQACTLTLAKSTAQFRSPFNGVRQTVGFLADSWQLSCTLPQRTLIDAGEVEAFFFFLSGGENRVRAWHFGRPVPRGTMRGSPTLGADAARGAGTITISNAPAFSTLERGDMLVIGDQLVQVRQPCTFSGAGVGEVGLVNRLRAAMGSGTTVLWNKPTSTFVMPGNFSAALVPGLLQGAAIDLEEAWST